MSGFTFDPKLYEQWLASMKEERALEAIRKANAELVVQKAFAILDDAFELNPGQRNYIEEIPMSAPVAAEREPAFVAVGNKLDIALNLANELTLQLNNVEHKLFGPTTKVPPQPEEKKPVIATGQDFVLLSYNNILDRLHDELRDAQRIISSIQRELP